MNGFLVLPIFNTLTGDILQVGTVPGYFYHTNQPLITFWTCLIIFTAYSKKEPAGPFKSNCV